MENTYNGYTNWETWNACLWIANDQSTYNYVRNHKTQLVKELSYGNKFATLKRLMTIACNTDLDYKDYDKINYEEVINFIEEL